MDISKLQKAIELSSRIKDLETFFECVGRNNKPCIEISRRGYVPKVVVENESVISSVLSTLKEELEALKKEFEEL